MSIFQSTELACPVCGNTAAFDLVVSVSADRRPDLRQEILDGKFQSKSCPSCDSRFRVDPEFTFIDLARGQYIGVWPVSKRREWRACADLTLQGFDAAFGRNAGPEAQAIGGTIEPRAVFGWPALVEKILARSAGIDDRTLELAKVAALQRLEDAPLPGANELRLVNASPTELVVAWVHTEDERLGSALRIPRSLIAEIEKAPDSWRALRDDVSEGLVVDFQREMLAA